MLIFEWLGMFSLPGAEFCYLGKIESHLYNQRAIDQAKSLKGVWRGLNPSDGSDANYLGNLGQIVFSLLILVYPPEKL